MSLPGINGIIELIGGVLIVLGLFTRPVAFILAGDMAVAYFLAHAPRGFFPLLNAGELAIVYCFVFLYLAVAGGGVWSLDHLRTDGKASRAAWRTAGR
jgi:putative oxidoreductase